MSTTLQVRPGEVPVPPWSMPALAWETYRSLGPLTYPDPDNGWALAALVDAWSTVSSWLEEAVRPAPTTGESPWAACLDPARCPWWALRWCGQAFGLRLQPALPAWQRPDLVTETRWRQEITDRMGWRRGHPDTIAAAARRYMHGQMRVSIRERYNPALGAVEDAPGYLQIRVRASDVDDGQDDALTRTVLAAIPIGLIAQVVITDDRDYDELDETWSSYDAAAADLTDYNDMLEA